MKRVVVTIVEIYRRFFSPMLGKNCRFYPSCSQYMIDAVNKKGAFSGVLKGLWRIARCNPWNKNCGYDPVE
jgi:uncharacterized protein